MASIENNRRGPIWVLGNITNVSPGTPVGIMSLVDSASTNDPNNPTSPTSDEYTVRAYEIIFQACKVSGSGLGVNTGNIYILKRGASGGTANRSDPGVIVAVIPPGTSGVLSPAFRLTASALNRNVFNPYDFLIDADNAGDGCQVVLEIQ